MVGRIQSRGRSSWTKTYGNRTRRDPGEDQEYRGIVTRGRRLYEEPPAANDRANRDGRKVQVVEPELADKVRTEADYFERNAERMRYNCWHSVPKYGMIALLA
jgi:hypothetical protein